jgi:hypothetical protein
MSHVYTVMLSVVMPNAILLNVVALRSHSAKHFVSFGFKISFSEKNILPSITNDIKTYQNTSSPNHLHHSIHIVRVLVRSNKGMFLLNNELARFSYGIYKYYFMFL